MTAREPFTPIGSLSVIVLAGASTACATAATFNTPHTIDPGEIQGGVVVPAYFGTRERTKKDAAPFESRQLSVDSASYLVVAAGFVRAGLAKGVDGGVTASGREGAADVKVRLYGQAAASSFSVAVNPLADSGWGPLRHVGGAVPVIAGWRFAKQLDVYASAGPGYAAPSGGSGSSAQRQPMLTGAHLRSALGVRTPIAREAAIQLEVGRRDLFRDSAYLQYAGLAFVFGRMP